MSAIILGAADILVAILLVATIATSVRLSRRIAALKADEAAMRATIGELLTATDRAERAVAGLRATVQDSERSLAAKLRQAAEEAANLDRATASGEAVMDRIGSIVDVTRRAAGIAAPPLAQPAPSAVPRGAAAAPSEGAVRRHPAAGDALREAIVAAQAIAERAARRSAA